MIRPAFAPKLVNGQTGDPALFVDLPYEGRALQFDLGRLDGLKPSEILRITDIFISHTHIDHFIGFDHFLRIALGHGKTVRLFGPTGLIENVAGKFRAYTWNLVGKGALTLDVTELGKPDRRRAVFRSEDRFAGCPAPPQSPENGLATVSGRFGVHFELLDHMTPSVAYAVREKPRWNVDRGSLERAGWEPGPWLAELKNLAEWGSPQGERFELDGKSYPVQDLIDRLLVRSEGDSLGYLADCGWTAENEIRAVKLLQNVKHLYCEGAFPKKDEARARQTYHLTATDAGMVARRAHVGELTIFHLSPRYVGIFSDIFSEAEAVFRTKADKKPD